VKKKSNGLGNLSVGGAGRPDRKPVPALPARSLPDGQAKGGGMRSKGEKERKTRCSQKSTAHGGSVFPSVVLVKRGERYKLYIGVSALFLKNHTLRDFLMEVLAYALSSAVLRSLVVASLLPCRV